MTCKSARGSENLTGQKMAFIVAERAPASLSVSTVSAARIAPSLQCAVQTWAGLCSRIGKSFGDTFQDRSRYIDGL